MKKIGLYGGTFDPIHCAHLILAREAVEQLGLAQMIFIPAAVSPHKLDVESAPAAVRLEMLRAAVAGEPLFAVDEWELRRAPPSFTIETIEEFRRAKSKAELFYCIGSDQLAKLETWHRFEDLRALVQFVVLDRGTVGVTSDYPTIRKPIDISSTEIRKRVAMGRSLRYLVPSAVEEIIQKRHLYQEPQR